MTPLAFPSRDLTGLFAALVVVASLGAFVPARAQDANRPQQVKSTFAAVQTAPDDQAPEQPETAPDEGVTEPEPDQGDAAPPVNQPQGTNPAPPNGRYGGPPRGMRGRGDGDRESGRRLFLENRMRQMMARSGVSSRTTQDAVLEFLRQDEESKRTVREVGSKLRIGMQRDVPAERLRALLSDYQKSLQEQRDWRTRAQTALDARVGYSLDPHLESMLWLLGILGDGQNFLSNSSPATQTPMRRPREPFGNGITVFSLQSREREIEGAVNAKNRDGELPVWLEIRDTGGQLWRMVPQNEPNAQTVLSRQIQGLLQGTRIVVRVAPPQNADAGAQLSLLAIIPANVTNANNGAGTVTPNP